MALKPAMFPAIPGPIGARVSSDWCINVDDDDDDDDGLVFYIPFNII